MLLVRGNGTLRFAPFLTVLKRGVSIPGLFPCLEFVHDRIGVHSRPNGSEDDDVVFG